MNFSIGECFATLLFKKYDLKSHIKGYHAHMKKWNPTTGELLKARFKPENEFDKFAVAVENVVLFLEIVVKLKLGKNST